MTLMTAPPRVAARSVARTLLATDYHRAAGRIDVVEDGVIVRSCRFVHVPSRAELRVQCAIDGTSYVGEGGHAYLERPDGARFRAGPPSAPRDIPNWLLCPSLAPIWGRPGECWQADLRESVPVRDGLVTVPLRSDGFFEAAWPGGYLRRLVLGAEHYVLRELNWQPTH
jgi:hypothetical protein